MTTINISNAEYALILKAFGLHPLPIADGFPRETDVLLFGNDRDNRPRPPLVAGYFTEGTDCPGWYTRDHSEEPIDMVPTHYLKLTAFEAVGLA